jgi:hypothetical protein
MTNLTFASTTRVMTGITANTTAPTPQLTPTRANKGNDHDNSRSATQVPTSTSRTSRHEHEDVKVP